MMSEKFMEALRKVKESGQPLHQIAWDAGVSPNVLYKITAGIDRPKRGNKNVKKLCAYLGLNAEDAFMNDQRIETAKG